MFNEKELKLRKKTLVLFSLLAILFLSFFGYYNFTLGMRQLGLLELISASILLANTLFFLTTKELSISINIFLTVISLVMYILFISGGIQRTGIFWIFLYPLITPFLKEPRKALYWNVGFTAGLIGILIAENFKILETPYDPITLRQSLVVYFSVLILSYLYSKLSSEILDSVKTVAVRDPLTGLYNRAFALSYLRQELEKVKRRELQNLCIAYLDLDNFKLVNDLLGHSTGDSVLSDIGDLLKHQFRKSDVVARIGGDEFIIIFTNCNPERIRKRLELLRSRIEEKFKKFGLSMSFGIAEAPKDALTAVGLIRIADERMYANKKKRRK
jgi:diguanylate cyclase (GGDEF)-like protein